MRVPASDFEAKCEMTDDHDDDDDDAAVAPSYIFKPSERSVNHDGTDMISFVMESGACIIH